MVLSKYPGYLIVFADRDGAGPAVRTLAEMLVEQTRGRRRADRP
jgi:hypothetical protein